MEKINIILPSWKPLGAVMHGETGVRYPAFIQLGGQPLYVHILKSYEAIKDRAEFFLILPPDAPEVSLTHLDGYSLTVIRLESSKSIGHTVFHALQIIKAGVVLIHMADTLIAGSPLESGIDRIYVQMRSDLHRWTVLKKLDDGGVGVLIDRQSDAPATDQLVCVGVFQLADGLLFTQLLKNNLEQSLLGNIDPFFLGLSDYSKCRNMHLEVPNVWHDCGHLENYYLSRLNFHNLRHFNRLTYDSDMGIVTKRSENQEAFRHQVRWYRQVPDELRFFLPRIFESSDGVDPFITMELLSIPTLSDLFISKRLELGAWNNVAKKIKLINEVLNKYIINSSVAKQISQEIYVAKTKNRLLKFIEQRPEAIDFWVPSDEGKFTIKDVLNSLERYAKNSGLLNIKKLSPIHGDFCFSNIMFDPRSGHIKLIDPRGEFGIPGIYGDPDYDKAKILHSCEGGYDLIISDHFELSISEDGEIICELGYAEYHHMVKDILQSALFESAAELKRCSAIEALLFLSMLPLHNDKPQRQLAMLYNGLNLYLRNLQGLNL
jgi:hypothetical protein